MKRRGTDGRLRRVGVGSHGGRKGGAGGVAKQRLIRTYVECAPIPHGRLAPAPGQARKAFFSSPYFFIRSYRARLDMPRV